MTDPYSDIIRLPHPEPKRRKRMSMIDRAAQFSPFAALTGYDAVIRESGRLTEREVELAADGKAMLDEKLRALADRLEEQPQVSLCCFVPDERKTGGAYVTVCGRVKRLDSQNQQILMEDGTVIPFGRILDLTEA